MLSEEGLHMKMSSLFNQADSMQTAFARSEGIQGTERFLLQDLVNLYRYDNFFCV